MGYNFVTDIIGLSLFI